MSTRLIDAAPDLYAVAQTVMEAVDGHTEWSPSPSVDNDTWNEDYAVEVHLTIRDLRALKRALAKATP